MGGEVRDVEFHLAAGRGSVLESVPRRLARLRSRIVEGRDVEWACFVRHPTLHPEHVQVLRLHPRESGVDPGQPFGFTLADPDGSIRNRKRLADQSAPGCFARSDGSRVAITTSVAAS